MMTDIKEFCYAINHVGEGVIAIFKHRQNAEMHLKLLKDCYPSFEIYLTDELNIDTSVKVRSI